MSLSLNRKLAVVVVAIAVAASAAGAYAATHTSPASGRQAFLADVAHRLHVTPQQLRQAVQGAFTDRLAAAVKAGRLSKAQASAIEQRIKHFGGVPFGAGFGLLAPAPGFPKRSQAGFGPAALAPPAFYLRPGLRGRPSARFRPGLQVPAPGPALPPGAYGYPQVVVPRGRPAGPLGFGFGFGFGLMPSATQDALSYLGLSPAKLQHELGAGKSLSQIASAQGKSARGLESVVESALRAELSKLVAAHHLTSAQAKRFLTVFSARVAAIVHGPMPMIHWAVAPGARGRIFRLTPGRLHPMAPHPAARKRASAATVGALFQA